MALIITPWVDMLAGHLNRGDCALSMTGSLTSTGWLRNTNLREIIGEDADAVQATVHIKTVCLRATLFFNAGINEYSQWFLGWENSVADALSRDFDCSDNEPTQIIRYTCPSQIPRNFQIVPLPNKISSWLTLLLLKLPMREQLRETHTRTKLGCGTGSPSISNPSEMATGSSLIPSQDLNETRSLELLPTSQTPI